MGDNVYHKIIFPTSNDGHISITIKVEEIRIFCKTILFFIMTHINSYMSIQIYVTSEINKIR